MTRVDADDINGVTVISVAGHAGYSNDGDDIVCAALSAITQSLLQTLKCYESIKKCKILSEQIKENVGCCLFSFISYSENETDALVNMAIIGYKMLQNTYPENVLVRDNRQGGIL